MMKWSKLKSTSQKHYKYKPSQMEIEAIKSAYYGAGAFIICVDEANARYVKTRLHQYIKSINSKNKICVSWKEKYLIIWNKMLYNKKQITNEIVDTIIQEGKLYQVSDGKVCSHSEHS